MSEVRIAVCLSIVVLAGCGGSSDGGIGSDASTGSPSDGAVHVDDGAPGTGDDGTGSTDDGGGSLPIIGADGGIVVPDDDAGGGRGGGGGGVTTPPRGTDGGPGQIVCGAKPCDSATEVCCVGRNGSACTAAAACKGDSLACSGTNSCTTGVCCEDVTRNAVTATCAATCAMGAVQLCTTNADCSGDDICSRTGGQQICRVPPRPRGDGGVPTFPARDAGFPGFPMRGDGG